MTAEERGSRSLCDSCTSDAVCAASGRPGGSVLYAVGGGDTVVRCPHYLRRPTPCAEASNCHWSESVGGCLAGCPGYTASLPWPAWLGGARHYLIDLEQQAALGSDAPGAVGEHARALAVNLDTLRACLAATEEAAAALLRAVSEVVP